MIPDGGTFTIFEPSVDYMATHILRPQTPIAVFCICGKRLELAIKWSDLDVIRNAGHRLTSVGLSTLGRTWLFSPP